MSKHRTRNEVRAAARRVVRFYAHRPLVLKSAKVQELRDGWEIEGDLPINRSQLEESRQRYTKDRVREIADQLVSCFGSLEIPEKARVRRAEDGWHVACCIHVPRNEPEWFDPQADDLEV